MYRTVDEWPTLTLGCHVTTKVIMTTMEEQMAQGMDIGLYNEERKKGPNDVNDNILGYR